MKTADIAIQPKANQWIFNPAVDLLIGCGAWSLPLLAVTFYLAQRDAVHVSFVFYFLGVFCNQPHYMATVYRAYHTPEDFRKYRFFTLYLTSFIALTALVVHLAPALFPWLLTSYLTWSPWHYTGQNFGISIMLARRAGAKPSDDDRQLIWWSYFASYAAWFLALHNTGTASQPSLLILPIPELTARAGKLFFFLMYLFAGVIGHYRLVRQIGWRAMVGPLTLFATQFLWFLLPELLREFTTLQFPTTYSSAGILAFMHCAQYLWITTYYTKRETESAGAGVTSLRLPSPTRFRWSPYYVLLVLGGIALFLPGPWLASRFFGHDLVESFFIFTALINLHHFILDGAIWKLRDGRIARLLLGRNPPLAEQGNVHHDADARPYLGWMFGPGNRARWLRYSLAVTLLLLAALDQTQFWLTLRNTGQSALALAQRINPNDTRTYFLQAKSLAAKGETASAIDKLRQALAINTYNIPAQHLLGELLYRSGDTAAALAHYDRMLTLFRPDLVMLVNSGILASRNGDKAKAVERFETALRLAPENTQLHLYLGETLEKAGNVPQAIREYELYAKLHRTDTTTSEVLPTFLLVGLKLGTLYPMQNQRELAVSWLRRAVELGRAHQRPNEAAAAEAKLRELGISP